MIAEQCTLQWKDPHLAGNRHTYQKGTSLRAHPASYEQFWMLVEGITDYAIFVLDPAGHIRSWNSGAGGLRASEADEALEKRFSLVYTAQDLAAKRQLMI